MITARKHEEEGYRQAMRQIAQAVDDLGYEGVLLPTGASCEDAWVVDAYDWVNGAKFQTIGAYDCYTLAYAARPLVLSCVSPDGELAVSE